MVDVFKNPEDVPSLPELDTSGNPVIPPGGVFVPTSPGGTGFVPSGVDTGRQFARRGLDPEELIHLKNVEKAEQQADIERQRQLEIGRQATVIRDTKPGLREEVIAVKRNIGESDASFEERQRSVGRAVISQGGGQKRKPIFRKEDVKKKTFKGVEIGKAPRLKSSITGTEFVIGSKLNIQDVTRQGTIPDIQPTFKEPKVVSGFFPTLTIDSQKEGAKVQDISNVPQLNTKSTIPNLQAQLNLAPSVVDVSATPTFSEKLRDVSFRDSIGGGVSVGGVGAGVLAGAIVSGKGTVAFGKGLVTQPVETVGQTVQSIVNLPKTLPVIGATIESEPSFALGFALGEVAQFKAISVAQKGLVQGFDVIRTQGLRELKLASADDIPFLRRGKETIFERTPLGRFKEQKFQLIAPEFPKQTFPRIKKGQSAGELFKEFKPILPKEKLPSGFTASPNPIGDLVVGKGSSEIGGLFQAPRVSPRFLRIIDNEKKLVSVGILGDTLRPTVFRVTPSRGFTLGRGIKSSTTKLQSSRLTSIKQSIETAPKGRSTIPFIKAEKESIITLGSQLTQPETRFFFKFEGRRIPIQQTTALKQGVNVAGSITGEDLARSISSSSRRLGGGGIFSPLDIATQLRTRGSSSSSKPFSSSSIKLSGSFGSSGSISSSASRGGIRSSGSISSSGSSRGRGGGSSSGSSASSRGISIGGSISSSRGGGRGRGSPPFGIGGLGLFKGRARGRTRTPRFGVSIRQPSRKFSTIGVGSLAQVISIGSKRAKKKKGIDVIKITPLGSRIQTVRTPTGFKRGRGLTFIEK